MNSSFQTTFGFKYVDNNYVMYNRLNGRTINSTDECGIPANGKKMWHLMYCHQRDAGYTMDDSARVASMFVRSINGG